MQNITNNLISQQAGNNPLPILPFAWSDGKTSHDQDQPLKHFDQGGSIALGKRCRVTQPSTSASSTDHLHKPKTRWQLQDAARKLLPHKRVRHCLRTLAACSHEVHVVKITKGDGSSSHAYAGLQRCASPWDCPICAGKIMEERRGELKTLVARARLAGYHVTMLTQTVRHSAKDGLEGLMDGISKARRLLRNRKAWKKVMAKFGLHGSVRALEVTVGTENGWHVHYHELLITKEKLPPCVELILRVAWSDACETAGLERPNEHGINLRSHKQVDEYVAKWGLADEMFSDGKGGRKKNSNPWQLLSRYLDGDKQAGQWFRVYSKVFAGKSQLRWSKGLREFFLMGVSLTDEEIIEREGSDVATTEHVMRIAYDEYKEFTRVGIRGYVLELFNRYDLDMVDIWMALPLPDKLRMLHHLGLSDETSLK